MKQNGWTALAAIVGIAVGVAWSNTSIARDQTLPQAVQDAVKRAFPQATFGASERDHVALRVYEVAVKDGAETLDVKVAADGTIVEVERKVAQDSLPANVASALSQAVGKGTVSVIERTERRAQLAFVTLAQPKVVFEAKVQQDGRRKEIFIDQDGALTDDEDDDGDEDDDDGEDDDEDDEDEDDDD